MWIQKQINRTYLPVFAFMEEETGIHKDAAEFLRDVILLQMPIYKYSEEQAQVQISIEDEDTFDMLIREEGTDEDRKGLEEGALEYEEDALHIDSDLEKAMKEENDSFNQTVEEENAQETEEEEGKEEAQETEEGQEQEFQKAQEKSYEYDWASLTEYEDIVSAFYAIDSTTSITDEQLVLKRRGDSGRFRGTPNSNLPYPFPGRFCGFDRRGCIHDDCRRRRPACPDIGGKIRVQCTSPYRPV